MMVDIKHFFAPFPEIDLGEIILREIRQDDAEDYYQYMSRQEMRSFLTQDNIPESIEKAVEEVSYWRSLFTAKRSIYWAIALKDNNQMIGTAGFNSISFSHARAEISYDLDPAYWGKGLMLKSVKAILKFADVKLKLARIQATVITENDRSLKVLQRCGFKQEGVLEKYEFVDGKHKDYYMYARVDI